MASNIALGDVKAGIANGNSVHIGENSAFYPLERASIYSMINILKSKNSLKVLLLVKMLAVAVVMLFCKHPSIKTLDYTRTVYLMGET